jgi:SAM-dependent methyltransferase
MNRFLQGVAQATAEAFPLPGPIVEIGSYQVENNEGLGNLRQFFPGRPYLGVDMRQGPGVDLVADVEQLPLADRTVGTVLAMSTFEHVPRFWKGLEQIRRVLRPDGVFLISCPFYFHIHNHPSDYWRFTPEALDLLLSDYPQRILGWHGPAKRPSSVWAVAFNGKYPPITREQLAHYRLLLGSYAHEPKTWHRVLRYQMARVLCGRGPFAPYLDQDQWEITYRSATTPTAQAA